MDIAMLALLVVIIALLVTTIAIQIRSRGGAEPQNDQLSAVVREELRTSGQDLRQDLSTQRTELGEHLRGDREQRERSHRELREDLEKVRRENLDQLEKMREAVDDKLRHTLTTSLAQNAERIETLTKSNADKHVELQGLLRDELDKLRQGNEAKLEQMRLTVDEKLQGTLEKRLGESFKLVSEQLDLVSKGLGEMQTLASDVGGLKRVLTNVKSRGTWGEVQLERQLEDVLTRDQFDRNVAVTPGSSERVEFAVRLPGKTDDAPVYLPIDSKFPREDFDRLQEAQDAGDKLAVDAAAAALERAIVEQAKTISSKYVDPPHSTDFAIMYLPFESLFAEVVRRPGLMERLQHDFRVQIAGPSTLMAYLNSLQMGFRTLAIEQRSSEVWQVLAAAKNEFTKYGQVMDRLKKQLGTAQNTVDQVGTRTRAINRALRRVETAEVEESAAFESLIALDDVETDVLLSDPDAIDETLESEDVEQTT